MNNLKPGDLFVFMQMLEKKAAGLEVPSFLKDAPDFKMPATPKIAPPVASSIGSKMMGMAKAPLIGAAETAVNSLAESAGKRIADTPDISSTPKLTSSNLVNSGLGGAANLAAGYAAMSPDPFIGGAGKAYMVGKPLMTVGGAALGSYMGTPSASNMAQSGPKFDSMKTDPSKSLGMASRLGVKPEQLSGMSTDQINDRFNQARIHERQITNRLHGGSAPVTSIGDTKLEAKPLDPNSFAGKQQKYYGVR